MPTGKIKYYNPDKCYGFIAQDEGGDLFFHILKSHFAGEIKAEQRVKYEVTRGKKGLEAENIQPIELNIIELNNAFEAIYEGLRRGSYANRMEFEAALVDIKPHIKNYIEQRRVTNIDYAVRKSLVFLFEYCFGVAHTPYHQSYERSLTVLRKLLPWAPDLMKMLCETDLGMISNMIVHRGRTLFFIPDQHALERFLTDWANLGFKHYTPKDIYEALLAKPKIRCQLEANRPELLAILRRVFANIAESSWPMSQLLIAESACGKQDEEATYETIIAEEQAERLSIDQLIAYENNQTKTGPRVAIRTSKYARNLKLVSLVKIKREHRCQVCGYRLPRLVGGWASEVHHVVPLSRGGADDSTNMVVVCPNHHTYFELALAPNDILDCGNYWEVMIEGTLHRIEKN